MIRYLNIDSAISGRYTVSAPYKAGAGIGVLKFAHAHNRASAVFLRTFPHIQIMVGRAGASKDAPGSCATGYANPVRLTTPSLEPLDGEFSQLTSKEATLWQTANNSAPALSAFTSAPKSTADFSAHHASRKSCTSICCMSAATRYRTSIPPLFSAIWRMICASCNNSSSSKTNSINSCSGPFLHLAAGGLRTSVVKRIAA